MSDRSKKRNLKVGGSKRFSAQKKLKRATKKQSKAVKRGRKGQTPRPQKASNYELKKK